jgi:hypothetical protein
MLFSVITRLDKKSRPSVSSDAEIGTLARIFFLGETESEFSVESEKSLEGVSLDHLWVQEYIP